MVVKKITKLFFALIAAALFVVVAFFFYINFELTKDHDYLKSYIGSKNIPNLIFDMCYENKCYYEYELNDYKKTMFFMTGEHLASQLDRIGDSIREGNCPSQSAD